MSEKKMDWFEFLNKTNEEYGLTDSDWEPIKKCAVVRFDYDGRGHVSGTYKGRIVYWHRDNKLDIVPGDIWIVSLTENFTTGNNYYAKPMQKIDGSFLYQMKKEEIDSLADVIWEENKVVLEPFLADKYKEVMNEQIGKAVKERTEELEKIVSDLQTQLAEQIKINEDDKKIIESNEERIGLLNEKLNRMEKEPVQTEHQLVQNIVQPEKIQTSHHPIIRTGPKTLKSERFDKSRYFVNLTADHKMMLIRDDKNGSILCMDNTIELNGLATLLPFTKEYEMPADPQSRFGGIVVYLK